MAYSTYTTVAFVCGSRAHNTSDKSFLLFTLDAGMVYATARSVREERSRQRYALQDFSFVRVSLVRGKSGWRIGSVENECNVFVRAPSREARAGVLAVTKLLRQFVHGEEPHRALFADVRQALLYLAAGENVEHVYDAFALRLLHKLGYIPTHQSFEHLISRDDWITATTPLSSQAKEAVAAALESSHL